jgi:hypothetical protein
MQIKSGGRVTVRYNIDPLSAILVMVPQKQLRALEGKGAWEIIISSGRREA